MKIFEKKNRPKWVFLETFWKTLRFLAEMNADQFNTIKAELMFWALFYPNKNISETSLKRKAFKKTLKMKAIGMKQSSRGQKT